MADIIKTVSKAESQMIVQMIKKEVKKGCECKKAIGFLKKQIIFFVGGCDQWKS
nr:hypothetical protein [uncultured Pseudodesulfovibrio sp.]